MRIVTPKQMSKIEERSEKLGISRGQLMDNAGAALAKLIDGHCRENGRKTVVFLAGTGNNGGDCFAAANILVYMGYKITVVNVGGMPKTALAAETFKRLPKDRIEFIEGFKSEGVEAAEIDFMTLSGKSRLNDVLMREKNRMNVIKAALRCAEVIVDGVFGTGFHGSLGKEIIDIFAADSKAYRIAVDVPSGGNSETGAVSDGIFKADETLALGLAKTGMTQYPLRKFCGKITVADIGIPERADEIIEDERAYSVIGRSSVNFPIRDENSHKGTFGTVLVIAGSSSMRGAAAFAALGALRSGAGLVRIASVEKCIDTVSALVPEATYIELDCDDYGFMLYDSSKAPLLKAMEKADAVVIGCGMGVTPDTIELTKFVTQNAKCPVIIDADGINCIASDIDILLKKQTDIVITPHVGEMARLLDCKTAAVSENRFAVAERYAEKYGITVVLKGAGTVVADSKRTAVNLTGNAGMSVGGSGDVLSGIIGSAAAQLGNVFDGACAGVHIHGLAGDAAAEKLGMEAMLPRDIIECLSDAFGVLK